MQEKNKLNNEVGLYMNEKGCNWCAMPNLSLVIREAYLLLYMPKCMVDDY